MSKKRLHIAILVYSPIIYEGLYTILSQSDVDCIIYKVDVLDDLEELLRDNTIDLLITNPMQLVNREKDIKKIKKNFPDLVLAGINIGVVDHTLLSLFDFSITIFDTVEKIISQIKRSVNNTDNHSALPSDNLTEREIHVLTKVVHGLSNKEIADSLHISIHTVTTHRKNIASKTGIRSESGLTIYALSKNIISIDNIELPHHSQE